MPTYYLQPSQHAHVYQRPRAYSQGYQHAPQQIVYTHSSRSHHGHGGSPQYYSSTYPRQASGAYYASPQYLTPNYQYDPNRRQHYQGHRRSGSGNVSYASSAPSRYHDSARHSPSHHHSGQRRSSSQTRHRRSQSVPRQSVQIADAPRAHHRVSTFILLPRKKNKIKLTNLLGFPQSSSRPRQSSPYRSLQRDRTVGEPLSERIRRLFGFGSHSRSHHRDYLDQRTGRTVDWRGRPIYRV
ncbi:hypothetical protein BD414DRAFT_574649 [Trametes punicea]|nr:hypothetical protein BD414DRAFT_574649 [Trametes punicea]